MSADHTRGVRGIAAIVAALTALALTAPASARSNPEKDPRWAKVDGQVRALIETPITAGRGVVSVSLTIRPGEVGTTAASAAIASADGVITGRYADLLTAEVPVKALAGLVADARVGWIGEAPTPVLDVTGQGVAFIDADNWHAAGVTGAGVTIAIFDSGFIGYAALLGTELPAGVTTVNYCGSMDGPLGQTTEHGTGVAEIVHETAPDASLILVCLGDSGDLSPAVVTVDGLGASIITMSLGFFNIGPGDGTLGFESIFQDARNRGMLWVNSAGNYAQEHWGGAFSDSDGDGYHQWSGTDETIGFTLEAGEFVDIYLKWDDWPVSDNDFDLELWDGGVKVDESIDEQSGTQPPIEGLYYQNTSGVTQNLSVKVVEFSATTAPQMDLFVLEADLDAPVTARSLNDPSTSPLVVATGAVYYGNSVIEDFSARGPTLDGRIKPDVTAPDRVANSTYGSFAGTSAAAPHVAGAAALLLEAYPGITPEVLAALLESKTRDAGVPGPDNTYGQGIIDLEDPASQSVGLVDPGAGLWYLRQGAESAQFYFGNPGDYPFVGDWDCDGDATPGLYRQSDGFVYLRNSNTQGTADVTFFFGNPGDVPIAGDFDGDGCDTVSIYRPAEGRFFIINALGENGGGLGAAAFDYYFGDPGDKPFVGDFDGDGEDTIGLHRESTGLVYFRNTHTQGVADNQFYFGDPGDRLIAGDWNQDGVDSPAVYRPTTTTFYFRYTNTQGNADEAATWGYPTWLPITGTFWTNP